MTSLNPLPCPLLEHKLRYGMSETILEVQTSGSSG
jgi:hypothetical protein